MKNLTIFLLGLIYFSGYLHSQTNDTKEGLYNIAFGSIFGGIGALIKKKEDEKFLKVLGKGMGQGALGGYMVFESKRLVRNFNNTEDFGYIWPSRLLNSAGNSIMENAANNRDFYEQWHFHFGFNRLELTTKKQWKLHYRFMPLHFIGFAISMREGPLDFGTSLKTGLFVFNSKKPLTGKFDGEYGEFGGFAATNSIVISSFIENRNSTLAHELIHVYQNDSFVIFNSYLDKTVNSWLPKRLEDNGWWRYLYLDLSVVYFASSYGVDSLLKNNIYKRFFEQEAFYYSP